MTLERDELALWLRLVQTPGAGPIACRALLGRFGEPDRIFSQSTTALCEAVSPGLARELARIPEGWDALVEQTWQWLARSAEDGLGRAVLTLADPRYPQRLLHSDDPPVLLYVLGAAALLASADPCASGRCLAMVGSRNPSAQGAENAQAFAASLRTAGWSIVSGLALGIDAAAHAGALQAPAAPDTPATIAVVGTGLDRVYPRRNHALAQRIAQTGLIVSEYPLGTPPLAPHFPRRNRIIAGLSEGTLVVEAALASGSLITARLAAEQGREVFAIPGSIHAPQSRGCHALIKQGAKLVETAQDVLEELHSLPTAPGSLGSPPGLPAVPGEAAPAPDAPAAGAAEGVVESPLLRALGYDPMDLDSLSNRTGRSAAELQVELLELELEGQVARLPGGWFQRIGRA